MKEEKKKEETTQKNCVVGCLVLVIGVILFAALSSNSSHERDSSPERDPSNRSGGSSRAEAQPEVPSKTTAYLIAEEYVKLTLRAPATASFPDYWNTDRVVTISGTTYSIRSFVDAENAFGANIRTAFFVQMNYNGGDEYSTRGWDLLAIEVGE